jgi:hypothetical protein
MRLEAFSRFMNETRKQSRMLRGARTFPQAMKVSEAHLLPVLGHADLPAHGQVPAAICTFLSAGATVTSPTRGERLEYNEVSRVGLARPVSAAPTRSGPATPSRTW